MADGYEENKGPGVGKNAQMIDSSSITVRTGATRLPSVSRVDTKSLAEFFRSKDDL